MTTVPAGSVRRRTTRPRADALRNRERILMAAREIFVEQGPDAPLDEIARRAGIGNATLYRHFPDRQALVHHILLSVLARTADHAQAAAAEEGDPFVGLSRFVHAAADERIGAVCQMLSCAARQDGADLEAERVRLSSFVEGMLDAGRRAGTLRQDVSYEELMVGLSQLARPLPGQLDQTRFTHRNLQMFLDGLRVTDYPEVSAAGPIGVCDAPHVRHALP